MKLFKKTAAQRESTTLTAHLASYIESHQRKLADWLNARTNGISNQSLRYSLIIFCMVIGGYLVYVLACAFN